MTNDELDINYAFFEFLKERGIKRPRPVEAALARRRIRLAWEEGTRNFHKNIKDMPIEFKKVFQEKFKELLA